MKPKRKDTRHLWVVEMLEPFGKWHQTTGAGINRENGRWKLREWRRRNPDDKFRLRKYEAT